jgi:hypothetical protein
VFISDTDDDVVWFTLRERKLRLPPLTLIIGGASSGKSAFAERLVVESGLGKVYIATAEAHDDEMEAKIAEHRARRLGQGWRTVEAPLDLELPLSNLRTGEIALVDCVTFWLTNQILDDADIEEEVDVLLATLGSDDLSGRDGHQRCLGRDRSGKRHGPRLPLRAGAAEPEAGRACGSRGLRDGGPSADPQGIAPGDDRAGGRDVCR